MKLFRPTAILFVLLLAAMVIVPMVNAAPDAISPEKIKTDTNFIGVEKATSVANIYVKQFSSSFTDFADWKGATVKKVTTYYDINGKESAYSFDVLVNGQYAGYLMVSATRDNYPVLEFSKGKTPDREITAQNNAKTLASTDAKSRQATLGEGRPLYLGATFFYMEYPVKPVGTLKSTIQTSQDKILVDLNEKKIIDPKKVTSSGRTVTSAELTAAQAQADAAFDEKTIQSYQQQKKQEAQAEWDAVETAGIVTNQNSPGTVKSASASYTYEKTISGVPNFEWRWGCSPTSAAMVVGYWRNRGLNRLPDATIPHGDPLNQALATEMGTTTVFGQEGWTWPWMIAYGINRVVTVNYGYHYTSGSAVVTAYSWPAIQSEIDSDRPFVLSMLWAGPPINAFGHSVAAVGYGYDSWGSSKFIKIHDTWNTSAEPYIRFGNWASAMNTYERPDHTYSIISSAGPNGQIDPAGVVNAPTGTNKTYTITPASGYVVDEILVDNNPVTLNPYPFEDITSDHTIEATFKPESISSEWNWSTDGWGDWEHSATWSGGSGSEYGPLMVDNVEGNHGEHGTDTSLSWGSTQSSVWKTFTDPSGNGWNTVEFNGLMTASSVPDGRWMTIHINDQQVFGGTALSNPPGNGVPFTVKKTFPQSSTVTVKISNGQNPAWGPRFAMHYYTVKLSNEDTATLKASGKDNSFVIPDGSQFEGNVTATETSQSL
ncbi:MAG: C39 family peptidase [Methanoregula sp.]|jgi:hypothetical protein|nr:C39 family peptidase [Methanoregula sp.]